MQGYRVVAFGGSDKFGWKKYQVLVIYVRSLMYTDVSSTIESERHVSTEELNFGKRFGKL